MNRRSNSAADDEDVTRCEQDLAAIVERLSDEVEVMRQAVDELREALTHELRILRDALSLAAGEPPYRLSSMPKDSCAEDFHERVNEVDASVFDSPSSATPNASPQWGSVTELITNLLAGAPTAQLAAEAWIEDHDFTPDEVVEIDPEISDLFAEYPVIVSQGEDWFVVDDALGSLFLLWHRDAHCFVRRMTAEQQTELCRLARIEQDDEPEADELPQAAAPSSHRPEPPTNQQTLW